MDLKRKRRKCVLFTQSKCVSTGLSIQDISPLGRVPSLIRSLIQMMEDSPITPSHGTTPLLCHTSKFMEMGGRAHFFLSLVGRSSISALICDSFMPAMRLILGTGKWTAGGCGSLPHFQHLGLQFLRRLGELSLTQTVCFRHKTRANGKSLEN